MDDNDNDNDKWMGIYIPNNDDQNLLFCWLKNLDTASFNQPILRRSFNPLISRRSLTNCYIRCSIFCYLYCLNVPPLFRVLFKLICNVVATPKHFF